MIFFLSVFLMSVSVFANDVQTSSKIQNSKTSEDVVIAVMNDQYGPTFNKKFQCWVFSNGKEEEETYCVKPSKPILINADDGERIYFYATGDMPMEGEGLFSSASNVSSGLFGGFVLNKTPAGKWVYLAKENEFYYGTNGNCCSVPQLVKLSPKDDYAWLFTSGGVWQGIIVSSYSIVLPRNGGFVDLGYIPEIKEEDQNNIYRISFMTNKIVNGYYPIELEKRDINNNKLLSTQLIPFDLKKQAYWLGD